MLKALESQVLKACELAQLAGGDRTGTLGHYQTVHPAIASLLSFFDVSHLPPHLAAVSQPFHDLAHVMVEAELEGPEVAAGLRKLLEAKDCFVRAAVVKSRAGSGA